jgi:hypothetical protein
MSLPICFARGTATDSQVYTVDNANGAVLQSVVFTNRDATTRNVWLIITPSVGDNMTLFYPIIASRDSVILSSLHVVLNDGDVIDIYVDEEPTGSIEYYLSGILL